ncbi:MAG TPA: response regulator [Sphingobacteriaceae bacterium]
MEAILKILVVEDEDLMLKALEFRLKKDGYDVFTAKDGATALDLLKEHRFDLVLTDIMLPFVSGLEIVSKVKSDSSLKDTPVIVLSAVGLEKIVLEAFELGADDFITKPFNLNELTIRVKKHIKRPQFPHLSQAG